MIYNGDKDIPEVPVSKVYEMFPHVCPKPVPIISSPIKTSSILNMSDEQFEACLDIIATNPQFNTYEQWRNMLIIIKRYYPNERGIKLAKMFSEKVDTNHISYSHANWEAPYGKDYKFFINIEPYDQENNGITVGTLRYHAKFINPEKYNEIFRTCEVVTYQEKKLEWERTHFKVLNPLMYCEIKNNNCLITRTDETLKKTFKNIKCATTDESKKGKMFFIYAWMEDEEIRTYDCLDFYPNKPQEFINDDGNVAFNLYFGRPSPRVTESTEDTDRAFEMFLHIMRHLVGHVEEHFKFLCRMVAHYMRKPDEKTHFVLVFKSYQGAGKGLVWNFIGEQLIGKHYFVLTSDVDSIFGTFNVNAKGNILIVIDEAEGKKLYDVMNQIKNKSTEPTITINEKHKPQYKIKNFGNYVFLTNNPRALKVEDTDRRFVCFEAGNEEDISYNGDDYTFLTTQMQTDAFIYKAVQYFESLDLSKFNPRDKNIRPTTDLYKKMKFVPQFLSFLWNLFFERESFWKDKEDVLKEQTWSLEEWWNKYQEYCGRVNVDCKNRYTFVTDMKNYETHFIKKNRKKVGNFWSVDPAKFKEYLDKHNIVIEELDNDALYPNEAEAKEAEVDDAKDTGEGEHTDTTSEGGNSVEMVSPVPL